VQRPRDRDQMLELKVCSMYVLFLGSLKLLSLLVVVRDQRLGLLGMGHRRLFLRLRVLWKGWWRRELLFLGLSAVRWRLDRGSRGVLAWVLGVR
jgi:hypothetical protein